MSAPPVIVVGAGLAGLACATELAAREVSVRVVDAADAPGGRLRTDLIDGFALDRGFHVLQTAYPEARRQLDYRDLDLRPFAPGALVRRDARFHRLVDPWRAPLAGLATLLRGPGTLGDRLRIARLRTRLVAASASRVYARPERSTADALSAAGFSAEFLEAFLHPFLAGVFFDPELQASSRAFEYYFRAFATGDTALPADGIGAIPAQLAARLPAGRLRLGARVRAVEATGVVLDTGESLAARAVVLATDAWEADRLLGEGGGPRALATTCVHYAARTPPIDEPLLVLNGEGRGLVNSLLVPSLLSERCAPPDEALIMVNVLGDPGLEDAALDATLRSELSGWFQSAVHEWRTLRVLRIPRALPSQAPPVANPADLDPRVADGLFACTERERSPSIQWSLHAGRVTAEAVSASLR